MIDAHVLRKEGDSSNGRDQIRQSQGLAGCRCDCSDTARSVGNKVTRAGKTLGVTFTLAPRARARSRSRFGSFRTEGSSLIYFLASLGTRMMKGRSRVIEQRRRSRLYRACQSFVNRNIIPAWFSGFIAAAYISSSPRQWGWLRLLNQLRLILRDVVPPPQSITLIINTFSRTERWVDQGKCLPSANARALHCHSRHGCAVFANPCLNSSGQRGGEMFR